MHGKRIKKTKRTTLRHKYKVQKKVREHHKKLRKEMKKNPGKFRRKNPGIPNSLPFKEEIVAEMKAEEERRLQIKEEIKLRRKEQRNQIFDSNRNITEFCEDAVKRQKEYEKKTMNNETETDKKTFTDRSAKAFYKEFKKVIEAADVILEVLDARDPQGTRCLPVEEMVINDPRKRLVLVLNKADLVPKESLEAWLKYLKQQHPTVLFKSSTQKQSQNLSHAKIRFKNNQKSLGISQCVGADGLMQLLKNYCRNCGIKTAISVGVVGLPNVGKSSLINSLKRTKACSVGAKPGITRTIQEVSLDSKVRILDCPGLILPGKNSSDALNTLHNAAKIETLDDPFTPVKVILNKVGMQQVMLKYTLPAYKDEMDFLALFARKCGMFKKGGVPNTRMAATQILKEWTSGRIKFYTNPPTTESSENVPSNPSEEKCALLNQLSAEFDLQELESSQELVLKQLPRVEIHETNLTEPSDAVRTISEYTDVMEEDAESSDGGEEENMEEDDGEENDDLLPDNVEINMEAPLNCKNSSQSPTVKIPRWETIPKNVDLSKVSLKKLQKQQSKKMRKERGRNERKTDDLATAMESMSAVGVEASGKSLQSDDAYDFSQYYKLK